MKSADYNNQMFKQVQDLIKKCDSLSQEIKDIKKQHKQEIYELNQKHEKEVKKLNEKINSLEKENAELKEKVDILEGKSNQKNSSNSSTPPSKDEYKVQNHREKSNRKQGGQKGRQGKTLTVEDVEKITEFLKILTNNIIRVSHGSLVNWVHEVSNKCRKSKKKLIRAIKKSKLLYTDATPTSLKGKYAYVRNYSNEVITVLEASLSERIQEIQRQNILPNFRNYIMHDHETGLYNFGIKSHHLECWIHLGRELKYFDEYIKNSWSKELWKFAWNLNKKRKELLQNNNTQFTSEEIIEYEKEYDEIIQKGIKQNKNTPSKYLKDKERAVLNRLIKYKENYLNYLKDFEFPFDDNLSERDLRATKLKKKVSGCHRAFEGLKDYSNIRTIISTCIKQGKSYFEFFKNILNNKPISINKQGLIMMS